MHESQIASSAYINDPAAARLLCASGDLRERPSEWPASAAEEVNQYWLTTTVTTTSAGTKEENGVDAEAELKEQEFQDTRAHIQSNIDVPTQAQKKRPAAKAPMTEEKRIRRDALAARSSALRKFQALIDKTTSELLTLETELPKLEVWWWWWWWW